MAKSKIKLTLRDLLARGYLTAGEELTCKPFAGSEVHVASVDTNGSIRYGDDIYKTPSPWPQKLAGSARNGWDYIRRKRDGRTLRSIHDEAIQEDRKSPLAGSDESQEESPSPAVLISESGVVPEGSTSERGVDAAGLRDRIMRLSPKTFENLVGEFLKAKGFENVEVTGQSKDGGIDGHCSLLFLKINVAFQAKRWSHNVPVEPVQRLVGSMSGRFERGVFVTTSDYSLAARNWLEETNPPVVALNGEEFAQQLLDLGLGVARIPIVERRIDEGFFESLDR